MAEALRQLDALPAVEVMAVSSLYRTPPWGKLDQPDFLNAAAAIATDLEPRALLQACLDIEGGLKRVRDERWGPRIIDLDVLVYGEIALKESGLEIPHPRLTERAFVLEPLAEIAPDLDVAGQSVGAWLATVDRTGIERLPGGRAWWIAP
jgi:2-amino-4-hydroxy-6-hydroxymethyldihydropteridine diphosphokinase